jgi:hypothetical protein
MLIHMNFVKLPMAGRRITLKNRFRVLQRIANSLPDGTDVLARKIRRCR